MKILGKVEMNWEPPNSKGLMMLATPFQFTFYGCSILFLSEKGENLIERKFDLEK